MVDSPKIVTLGGDSETDSAVVDSADQYWKINPDRNRKGLN